MLNHSDAGAGGKAQSLSFAQSLYINSKASTCKSPIVSACSATVLASYFESFLKSLITDITIFVSSFIPNNGSNSSV